MGSAVLAFAPHSGWAAAVALGGSPADPEVISRTRVEMADPSLPGSKQPYHEVEGLDVRAAERRLARLAESAGALAGDALHALVDGLRATGFAPRAAGILDSSGRTGDSLAAILRSHALIHTADGEHFRTALASACEREGMAVVRVRARDLPERASAALRKSSADLDAAIRALGRPLGPPWGADQKSAALLAWLLLAGR